MDGKKILYISIVSLVVLILVCILLSSFLDVGIGKAPGSDYTGMNTTQGTTDLSTQDSTGDSTEGTGGGNLPGNDAVVDEDFSINLDIENSGDFGEIDFDDLLPDSEPTTKPTTPEATTKPTTPEATTKPTTPEATTKPTTPEATTKSTTPQATTKPTETSRPGNALPAETSDVHPELPF